MKPRTLAEGRFVVVDVETSGLEAHRDRLLAIGAVAVSDGVIRLAEAFEATLRQDVPSSTENILVHGLGGTTQTSGDAPRESLERWLDFAADSPLVAFHAAFDRSFIRRSLREVGCAERGNVWLDLADLAPALMPEQAEFRTLDDWTTHFGIENAARHNAVADALATAQLFLIVLARAAASGMRTVADLAAETKAYRWLGASRRGA